MRTSDEITAALLETIDLRRRMDDAAHERLDERDFERARACAGEADRLAWQIKALRWALGEVEEF